MFFCCNLCGVLPKLLLHPVPSRSSRSTFLSLRHCRSMCNDHVLEPQSGESTPQDEVSIVLNSGWSVDVVCQQHGSHETKRTVRGTQVETRNTQSQEGRCAGGSSARSRQSLVDTAREQGRTTTSVCFLLKFVPRTVRVDPGSSSPRSAHHFTRLVQGVRHVQPKCFCFERSSPPCLHIHRG